MPPDTDGWSGYERLVMRSLDDLKSDVKILRDDSSKMKADLAALQVKAGVWGGLAGLIPFGLFLATRLVH